MRMSVPLRNPYKYKQGACSVIFACLEKKIISSSSSYGEKKGFNSLISTTICKKDFD